MDFRFTDSIQDYLKSIHALCTDGRTASTSALARRMRVAPASVTGMLQRLAALDPPLVTYRKHRGASLTKAGERAALEVIRHHRLLETYLVRSLGYSWDAVHEDACRMEHVISETFERRIADSLGHPERDPHGAPIPSAELVLRVEADTALSSVSCGVRAVVSRVRCEDPKVLRRLHGLGLVPGAELAVLEESTGRKLAVQVGDRQPTVISPAVSGQVFVQLVEDGTP